MTEISSNLNMGWIFYDADCPFCVRLAARMDRTLARRGFRLLPLQAPGAAERLGVTPAGLLAEMRLLTPSGACFGGADAVVEIARHIWWARPLAGFARLPGGLRLLRRLYAGLATNRCCLNGACKTPQRPDVRSWLPLLLLPCAPLALQRQLPGWLFMWFMAFALFAGCKWLTYRRALLAGAKLDPGRKLGYLIGWVGMDPAEFAEPQTKGSIPHRQDWLPPLVRIALGTALTWSGARLLHEANPLASGWLGMCGFILMLHFGGFHLLALIWQQTGIPVKPLMLSPSRSASLADFWGRRWNTGFHKLAYDFLFRPLVGKIGGRLASGVVFLASGLVHELVITVPARGGYGLPTAYFLGQGLGLAIERSALGRKFGLGTRVRGRLFALIVVAAPAFWLFPPVFVRNIILPMLHSIGAI